MVCVCVWGGGVPVNHLRMRCVSLFSQWTAALEHQHSHHDLPPAMAMTGKLQSASNSTRTNTPCCATDLVVWSYNAVRTAPSSLHRRKFPRLCDGRVPPLPRHCRVQFVRSHSVSLLVMAILIATSPPWCVLGVWVCVCLSAGRHRRRAGRLACFAG